GAGGGEHVDVDVAAHRRREEAAAQHLVGVSAQVGALLGGRGRIARAGGQRRRAGARLRGGRGGDRDGRGRGRRGDRIGRIVGGEQGVDARRHDAATRGVIDRCGTGGGGYGDGGQDGGGADGGQGAAGHAHEVKLHSARLTGNILALRCRFRYPPVTGGISR